MGSCVEGGDEQTLLAAPHYYWGCCMVCRQVGSPQEPLKRCSRCNSMFYCSVEHQKQHWKKHKRLCLYLATAAEEVGSNFFFSNEDNHLFQELQEHSQGVQEDSNDLLNEISEENLEIWKRFRINAAKSSEILIGNKLEEWEKEIFLFPRVCRFCRKGQVKGMLDCYACMSVSYCGQNCRDLDKAHHAKICPELKFAMACDNFESTISIAAPALPHSVDETFVPIPDSMELYLATLIGQTSGNSDSKELELRFLSDRLSGPLTILFAAQKFGLANGIKVEEVKNLTVHIVGAGVVEMLGIIKWEFIIHRLPRCQSLRLVFVGPEMEHEENNEFEGIGKCEECTSKNRLIFHDIKCQMYHDYAKSSAYQKPDMIVAFNCGFHEFELQPEHETWRQSIPFMLQNPYVPLVFTSYNKHEAERDLSRLKEVIGGDLELKIDVSAELNHFRSSRPIRDFEMCDNIDVFYSNQFYSVVRRAD